MPAEDAASALLNMALGNTGGQPPAAPPSEGNAPQAGATPTATQTPAPTDAGENEPDLAATLRALGVAPDKLADAQKLINDAKSRKGRELAEQNRQMQEQLAQLNEVAQRAKFLEEQQRQFEPLLNALKASQPKPDPMANNPTYQALIAKGYNPEQVADMMALIKSATEPEIQKLQAQRQADEYEVRRDLYLASIRDGDPKHPVPWTEVEPLIADTIRANPHIDAMGQKLFEGGATPEQLIDFLYSQVLANNVGKFAGRFVQTPSNTPTPEKMGAAPMRGAAPAPQSGTPTNNELAMQILQAARTAK